MVTIKRGNETLTVTRGAYNSVFAPQGWEEVKNKSENTRHEMRHENGDFSVGTEKRVVLPESSENEKIDNKSDAISSDIDLSEIPLSEMNVPQLKAYAKQLGVEVNTDSAKSLRNQIRKAMEG